MILTAIRIAEMALMVLSIIATVKAISITFVCSYKIITVPVQTPLVDYDKGNNIPRPGLVGPAVPMFVWMPQKRLKKTMRRLQVKGSLVRVSL